MKRLLSFALIMAILLSTLSMVCFAADTQDMFTVEELEQYVVHTELLSTDGYIGIPVGIKTYIKDPEATTEDTQVILYVVNTQTANIGRGDDKTILSGMLDRGYIVVVLDYFDAPETASRDLDWSIQQIRLQINKGSYLDGALHFEYSYVVPQGYDLKRDIVFWSVDKHAADGTIEHIIRSWNTDFLGVKGDKYYITFEEDTVISGVSFKAGQKLTPREYTAMLPEGKVTSIFECVGPNGKLVDMDLYMDIIYPVDPVEEVPVMVYACSGDYTMDTWNKAIRPHLTGFLMDGYAAACYSHPYVPMGAGKMFGYYDGTNAAGAVTGDASNGSLDPYNGLRVDTAAVRYVRYMAEEYKFATDRVGVTGISKTGSVIRLGHPHPETLPEDYCYEGHTGETRYDNGLTADMTGDTGVFRGGEAQPWLTYPGTNTPIPSNVQFIMTNVGGGQGTITPDHAPIYICGTMMPSGSYYGAFYSGVMTYSLAADIPVMDYVCENVGHDFPYGPDKETGNDTYQALFDCANYYLLGAQAKCEYIKPIDGTKNVDPSKPITVKFNAGVPMNEVKSKVSVINAATGKKVSGIWEAAYGNTLYTFTPFGMEGGYPYTVTVPGNILAENGKTIVGEKKVTFTMARSKNNTAVGFQGDTTLSYGKEMLFHFGDLDYDTSFRTNLRFSVLNDAANVVQIYIAHLQDDGKYTVEAEPVGEVNLCGAGEYSFDVTKYVNALDGEKAAFCLKTKKQAGESQIFSANFNDFVDEDLEKTFSVGNYAYLAMSNAQDADGNGKSIVFNGYKPRTFSYATGSHKYYESGLNVFSNLRAMGKLNVDRTDYGRKFRLEMRVYDSVSRGIYLEAGTTTLSTQGCDVDTTVERRNYRTVQGQWTDISFDYCISNAMQYTTLPKRNVVIKADYAGENAPMYMDNYVIYEIVTDVELGVAGSTNTAASFALVTYPVDTKTEGSVEFAYVESGANADKVMSGTNGILVSGQTLTITEDARKVYVKVPLAKYTGGPLDFSFRTQANSNGTVKVYGITDKTAAASWSSDTITYLNAPANDRLLGGVDLKQVFGGTAMASFDVNGAQTCSVNLINYASYMKNQGAECMTLILTVESARQEIVRSEDFEDEYKITVSGTSTGESATEDHTTGSGRCCYLKPYEKSSERLRIWLMGEAENLNVGESYRITFWAKSDATGTARICVMPKGTTEHYHTMTFEMTAGEDWKQITYAFTLNEDDLFDDPYIAIEMHGFGTLGDKTLYMDDFVLERTGLSAVTLEPDFTISATAQLVTQKTFDDWTTGTANYKIQKTDTHAASNTFYQYGGGTYSITESLDATTGSGKSFMYQPSSSGAKVKFYGVLDSLTEADIGRTLTISFDLYVDHMHKGQTKMKIQYGMISGLYRQDSATNGLNGEVADANNYQIYFYQNEEIVITEADVGKWINCSIEVTIDANMLPRAAGTRAGAEKKYQAGLGMFGIGCNTTVSSSPDTVLYIDNIIATEAVSESENITASEVAAVGSDGAVSATELVIQSDVRNETPDGIRKTYMTFAPDSEYNEAVESLLNIEVTDATAQVLKVYGLVNAAYPDKLTYLTAPGSNADESMFYAMIYGGDAIAEIPLNGAGTYTVDVTDYVRTYGANALTFVVTAEYPGRTEYLSLDFAKFAMTEEVDYTTDGSASISNGAMHVTGNRVDILNAFGNGGASDPKQAYTVSAKVTATSGTVTLSAIAADGSVVATTTVDASGSAQVVTLTVEAGAEAFSTVRVSATADAFTLEDVVVSDAAVVTLADAELTTKTLVEPVPTLSFSGAALALQHNLAIQYKVNAEFFKDGGFTDPYVVFTLAGKEFTVREYTIADGKYVFTFRNIAPNQMNDNISAVLHANYKGSEQTSAPRNYSVAEYCYSMLTKNASNVKLRTLLVDLLNYGAASQQYTGYNTGNLVNANLTDTQKAWATAEKRTYNNIQTTKYETVDNPTVSWKGGGLVLQDAVTMRFKFETADTEGLTFKVESAGKSWTITEFTTEGGANYIYFNGLHAGQMSEAVYVTAYRDGVAISNTVRYSIESYAATKEADTEVLYLADVVVAMMKYGDSAKAYIS